MEVKVTDSSGVLKQSTFIPNTITDVGKAAVAGLINGVVTDFFDYMAIGITTPGATALGSEIVTNGGERVATSNSRVTTTVTNDTAQFIGTWTFTGGFAITEAGVFSAAAAGTMLASQTFSAVNVVSGDSLTITWKVKQA